MALKFSSVNMRDLAFTIYIAVTALTCVLMAVLKPAPKDPVVVPPNCTLPWSVPAVIQASMGPSPGALLVDAPLYNLYARDPPAEHDPTLYPGANTTYYPGTHVAPVANRSLCIPRNYCSRKLGEGWRLDAYPGRHACRPGDEPYPSALCVLDELQQAAALCVNEWIACTAPCATLLNESVPAGVIELPGTDVLQIGSTELLDLNVSACHDQVTVVALGETIIVPASIRTVEVTGVSTVWIASCSDCLCGPQHVTLDECPPTTTPTTTSTTTPTTTGDSTTTTLTPGLSPEDIELVMKTFPVYSEKQSTKVVRVDMTVVMKATNQEPVIICQTFQRLLNTTKYSSCSPVFVVLGLVQPGTADGATPQIWTPTSRMCFLLSNDTWDKSNGPFLFKLNDPPTTNFRHYYISMDCILADGEAYVPVGPDNPGQSPVYSNTVYSNCFGGSIPNPTINAVVYRAPSSVVIKDIIVLKSDGHHTITAQTEYTSWNPTPEVPVLVREGPQAIHRGYEGCSEARFHATFLRDGQWTLHYFRLTAYYSYLQPDIHWIPLSGNLTVEDYKRSEGGVAYYPIGVVSAWKTLFETALGLAEHTIAPEHALVADDDLDINLFSTYTGYSGGTTCSSTPNTHARSFEWKPTSPTCVDEVDRLAYGIVSWAIPLVHDPLGSPELVYFDNLLSLSEEWNDECRSALSCTCTVNVLEIV